MSTRRDFLKTVAAGGTGFALAFHLPVGGRFSFSAEGSSFSPNAFLRISPENLITVVVKHSEMGQGVATSLPMIIADELDADWETVHFRLAGADPAYNHAQYPMQMTGGSSSVSSSFEQMRKAGATARMMLVSAAAKLWEVEPGDCKTEKGHVLHPASNRKLSYGKLAAAAAQETPPPNPVLKSPADFKIIGKPTKRLDAPSKTDGTAVFGMDVMLPDMVYAVVARSPIFGATLKSFDASKAEALKGVHKVFAIKSGVAVVALDYWTAKRGRDLLSIEWDDEGVDRLSTTKMEQEYLALSKEEGLPVKKTGDVVAAFAEGGKTTEASFVFPFLAHAPMEPLNCVAVVREDGCEIWTGTQFQTGEQMTAAALLGIPATKVKVNTTMLGGGFGRRANKDMDFTSEAVQIAKQISPKPVQTIWSREDDIRGGYYRPFYVHRVKAGIDKNGKPHAWDHHIVGQSIMAGTAFEAFAVQKGVDVTSVEGVDNMPYGVANLNVAYHPTKKTVSTLWWRSVGHTHTAFAVETMIDRLAHLAGTDPLKYRLDLLSDHPRHLATLKLAAEKAGWDQPLAEKPGFKRGRGVAVHESFGSVVAEVAEVSVDDGGKVKVDRVVCAVHCGRVVNPLTVEAQMQSAVVYGLTAALYGRITLENGEVQQSNFHDYQALRMNEMPVVETYLVPSDAAPTGVGEPGTPPIAPAVCNAIFAATGKEVNSLPIA